MESCLAVSIGIADEDGLRIGLCTRINSLFPVALHLPRVQSILDRTRRFIFRFSRLCCFRVNSTLTISFRIILAWLITFEPSKMNYQTIRLNLSLFYRFLMNLKTIIMHSSFLQSNFNQQYLFHKPHNPFKQTRLCKKCSIQCKRNILQSLTT